MKRWREGDLVWLSAAKDQGGWRHPFPAVVLHDPGVRGEKVVIGFHREGQLVVTEWLCVAVSRGVIREREYGRDPSGREVA